MSEIEREPIYTLDENGNELATFDADHSLADIARWIARNPVDAEEMVLLLRELAANGGAT